MIYSAITQNISISIIGMGSFGILIYEILTQLVGVDPSQIQTYHYRHNDLAQLEECYKADYIIVCAPLKIYAEMLCEIIAHPVYQSHQGVIIDICSIKGRPIRAVQKLLSDQIELQVRVRHIHPMRGPQSLDLSQPLAPQALRIVLCESHGVDTTLIDGLTIGMQELGFVTVSMSGEEHDRQAAQSQFRTYLIARIVRLAGLSSYNQTDIHGQLYDDVMMRTCRIFDEQDELFEPYAMYNNHCREVILRIHDSARQIQSSIASMGQHDGELQMVNHTIESEIVSSYIAQLLLDADLLHSTSVDTKNATRINTELQGATRISELPYHSQTIVPIIQPLIDSTLHITKYFIDKIETTNA